MQYNPTQYTTIQSNIMQYFPGESGVGSPSEGIFLSFSQGSEMLNFGPKIKLPILPAPPHFFVFTSSGNLAPISFSRPKHPTLTSSKLVHGPEGAPWPMPTSPGAQYITMHRNSIVWGADIVIWSRDKKGPYVLWLFCIVFAFWRSSIRIFW